MCDVKYAIFFSNGLGDHFLNLPAIRALAQLFPRNSLLISERSCSDFFFSDVAFDVNLTIESDIKDCQRSFNVSLVTQEIAGCDTFISLNPWHSQCVNDLLHSLRPRRSVGFFAEFSERLPLVYSIHSAELAFSVPRHFCPSLSIKHYLKPPPLRGDAQRIPRQVFSLMSSDTRILCVHADTLSEKMCPSSLFSQFLDEFLRRHSDYIAFLVGVENIGISSTVFADRIIPCYGLSLAASIGIVANADLFCGIDSVMLHAADFYGVPGIGIFRPTDPNEFGFIVSRHRHITSTVGLESIGVLELLDNVECLLSSLQQREPHRTRICMRQ